MLQLTHVVTSSVGVVTVSDGLSLFYLCQHFADIGSRVAAVEKELQQQNNIISSLQVSVRLPSSRL